MSKDMRKMFYYYYFEKTYNYLLIKNLATMFFVSKSMMLSTWVSQPGQPVLSTNFYNLSIIKKKILELLHEK